MNFLQVDYFPSLPFIAFHGQPVSCSAILYSSSLCALHVRASSGIFLALIIKLGAAATIHMASSDLGFKRVICLNIWRKDNIYNKLIIRR
jgi:hypothetical protein